MYCQSLLQIAGTHSAFLKTSLQVAGRTMLFVSTHQDLASDAWEIFYRVLLPLAGNAGSIVRKRKWLAEALVLVAMQLMCELEEDVHWGQKFDDAYLFLESSSDEYENSRISDSGTAAIDKLSNALKGKSISSVAIPLIKNYLQHADWRHRRSALYTICLLRN